VAKIQVQGIGMFTDDTLKKKIIDMANNLSKLAKKGEWSKSSENGIRALGRMWGAYQDWSRKNESVNEGPQRDMNVLADYIIDLNIELSNAKILAKKHPKYKKYIKFIQQDIKDANSKLEKIKKKFRSMKQNESLSEAIKKWKDIPKTGSLDFGKYGRYVILSKNDLRVSGRFVSGSNKGKKVIWYTDKGKTYYRKNRGLKMSQTPSFPFDMVKESVNEGKYHQYKNDESMTPKQKIGKSMREVRNSLNELSKLIDMNVKLKNELNVDSQSYWKNTHKALHKISERLVKLANKVGQLK